MRVGGVNHRGGRRYLEGWEAVATSEFYPPPRLDLPTPSISTKRAPFMPKIGREVV
jgi:hypothetical protein